MIPKTTIEISKQIDRLMTMIFLKSSLVLSSVCSTTSSQFKSGINRTFNQFKYKESLKVIYTTPGLPMHPLIAHPRVSERVKESLISHFLKLDESEEGKAMLREVKVAEPVRADHDRDR